MMPKTPFHLAAGALFCTLLPVLILSGCTPSALPDTSAEPPTFASSARTPTPTSPAPTSPPEVRPVLDKWALWTDGPQLRGANIWQRIRVPDLDGDLLGDGYIGPPYVQSDFDRLAALGANYVNLSIPGLFTERPPYVLDKGAQANLDSLLEMAARAGLFAVISFRTGPGRSDFTFYRDGAGDWFDPSLLIETVWTDQAAQDAWVEMWHHTAERYRANPVVVGYDLMVEPNADEVMLDLYNPAEFYPRYAGTLYDWNQFYPRLVTAIRSVDAETPILVNPMGWGSVPWLSALRPVEDERVVYAVHQYAPFQYTHQQPGDHRSYPGDFDVTWDGVPDRFDRDWLLTWLAPILAFREQTGAPVAVNEFGVVRWAPGAAYFLRDEIEFFEQNGLNYALWVWEPTYEPWRTSVDIDHAMFYPFGPDPNNMQDVENDLMNVILESWRKNTLRPSLWLSRSLAPVLSLVFLVSCAPQTVNGGRPTNNYQTVCCLASTANIPNPERGFYNWPDDFTPSALANYAAQAYTLVYQRENLRDYLHSDLPPEYLEALAARFRAVRQAGLKVILRFTYNEGETYPAPQPDAGLEQVLRYIAQMGRFVPISGETCNPNPPRSDCETALRELALLHWSALNEGWHPDVIQSWKDQGCYAEIRRRLGYRLSLLEAAFSPQAQPGSDLQVKVRLQNTGFASPLLERPVYLLLVAQDSILRYETEVDPRRWRPGERSFTATLPLPADLPPGAYTLALWLPDPADTLGDDPRYALRFANEGTWDAAHGWNVLGGVSVRE